MVSMFVPLSVLVHRMYFSDSNSMINNNL